MNQLFFMPLLAAESAGDLAILLVVGVLATVTALMAVTQRNPLYGAVFLIAFFLVVAVLYFRLAAPFIGIMQVLVYAGAIMVLYTFIIMLLDLSPQSDARNFIQAPTHEAPPAAGSGARGDEKIVNWGAAIVSFLTFMAIAWPVLKADEMGFFKELPALDPTAGAEAFGSAESIGLTMFGKFALPFEVVGVLLLVAAISGVVLAKRRLLDRVEDTRGLGRGMADKQLDFAGTEGGTN